MSEIKLPWLVRHLTKILFLFFVIAMVMGVVAIYCFYIQFGENPLSNKQEHWAQFGDFIGGVLNPVYAFLALIALLLTLRVQATELSLSTEELRNSAKALFDQNKSLELQNFESTFFQMVKLHNDLVAGIDFHSGGLVTAVGRDSFRVLYKRFLKAMEPVGRGDYLTYEEGFVAAYTDFFEHNEHNLGHYFRNLHRIYKFIDESNSSKKSDYAGIIRAQLSSFELLLIFYNGKTKYGEKFKRNMERYAMFENMPYEKLNNWRVERSWYAKEAYGDQASEVFED